MTIEEVRYFYQSGGDSKFSLEEEIREQVLEEKKIDSDIQEARAAGDSERFIKLKTDREFLEERIRFNRDRLAKCPPYTRADILDAWNGRVTAYNEEFRKRFSEYVALRKQLFCKFEELYKMQELALKDKRMICGSANPAVKLSLFPKSHSDIRFQNKAAAAEIVFFADAGLLEGTLTEIGSDLVKMNSVLLNES